MAGKPRLRKTSLFPPTPSLQSPAVIPFPTSLATTLRTFEGLAALEPAITRAGDLILETLRGGGKPLISGNGGSAAEAGDLVTELTGLYPRNPRATPAPHPLAAGHPSTGVDPCIRCARHSMLSLDNLWRRRAA